MSYLLHYKPIRYDIEKNRWLMAHRHISFEEITMLIAEGHVAVVVEHPNQERYVNQKMMVLDMNGYAWGVPFVEADDHIFLKTAFPSRKLMPFLKKHGET